MSDQYPESFREFQQQLHSFVAERDWSQFHTPKNLAMALAGEVGELVEHFQWLSNEASDSLPVGKLAEVRRELADIQIYTLLLANRLELDLAAAVRDKIAENEAKYPPDRAFGRSDKYTDL
ncbi:nucleotide pyrophosphohydrolase [Halorhodospira halophila]|uniref:MazG nucleotide pyrophosphohydrolase n=1 Tax=Halorhodospira halophila (strain DSM 244 / SL1) TaxID=349124 RepID=A1WWK5_HALHL|nr:nucleotide pyrophosphohydrolase [Halorhodospira halophila]ABM62067.1 MazG nucleotide pyrophosphohydrolase [Halorhodospira halophila SL1]MBK1730170.1 nucleotide pyrophosphohydrolase [Halorhodospira halophila]